MKAFCLTYIPERWCIINSSNHKNQENNAMHPNAMKSKREQFLITLTTCYANWPRYFDNLRLN